MTLTEQRSGRRGLGSLVRRVPRRLAVSAGVLVLALLVPLVVQTSYQLNVATLMVIYAIVTHGLDIVTGRLGLVSVAHAALMTVGAYVVAILTTIHGVSYWLAYPAAVAVTTVVGLLLALVTMRSHGHYFAVSSLAFAAAMVILLREWESVTRGAQGIYGIPMPPGFGSQEGLYYLSLMVLVAVVVAVALLARSTFGRNLRVMKSDLLLASSLGIDIVGTRLKAFSASAAICGVAGGLFASWISYINPQNANILAGFDILVYDIIGGVGTLAGPIVGAVIVVGLSEVLRFAEVYRDLLFGVLAFAVVLFFRGGVVGSLAEYGTRLRGRLRGSLPTPADGIPEGTVLTDAPGLVRERLGQVQHHSTGPEPLLEVRSLDKRFGGVRAVQDVSLDASPGEIVGVMGPNGAGKSTLFGMIAGTVRQSDGSVVFHAQRIESLKAHRRARLGIGRTFQTNRLLGDQTVLENLLAASYAHLAPLARRRAGRSPENLEYLYAVLELLGLADQAAAVADSVSVEEQRLVGIGMALAVRPRLLLLDEPFAGLRETEIPRLIQVLERLREFGLAVLLVEHNMRVVMSVCDRCYVLDQGALISAGTPETVASDTRVIDTYLGVRRA